MLNSELWGLRRAALVAATVVISSVLAACGGPPPMPAEVPANRAQAAQQAANAADPSQAQAQTDPGQAAAQGEDDANIDDFYEPLAAYGTWVETPEYGKVWQPADDVAGETFTPYASDGSWAANDDGDWVFQSRYESEFGWATYHYGRWADHDDYGWVWVPGTAWAPSWVEWRYGGGYVGWAPLGPQGYVATEDRWFFVEERNFSSPTVYAYRLGSDRTGDAYVAAAPIVEMRGRWSAGPPVAHLRSSGVAVRTVHARSPGRGYVKTTARSVRTASASRPRPAAKARMRTATAKAAHHAAKAAHHAAPKPAHHEAAKPAAKKAPPPPAKKAPPPPAKKKKK